MQQKMIQHNARHHRFSNWYGPDSDTGIMAAFGNNFSIFTRFRNSFPCGQD
jgi:hypothetical protein